MAGVVVVGAEAVLDGALEVMLADVGLAAAGLAAATDAVTAGDLVTPDSATGTEADAGRAAPSAATAESVAGAMLRDVVPAARSGCGIATARRSANDRVRAARFWSPRPI